MCATVPNHFSGSTTGLPHPAPLLTRVLVDHTFRVHFLHPNEFQSSDTQPLVPVRLYRPRRGYLAVHVVANSLRAQGAEHHPQMLTVYDDNIGYV
jgi:hypothetical protein